MNTHQVALPLAACLIAGCASAPNPALLEAEQFYRQSVPTCSSPKECEAKWAAARNWVLSSCGMRLQHVEADFLETYRSGDSANTDLYCRVTRTPISETAYRIELVAGANNPFMYSRSKLVMIGQSFNDAVNAAWRK